MSLERNEARTQRHSPLRMPALRLALRACFICDIHRLLVADKGPRITATRLPLEYQFADLRRIRDATRSYELLVITLNPVRLVNIIHHHTHRFRNSTTAQV